ncbi:hypothetical protein [Nonomuraea diastatica]|uniref:DUF4190 domain-containing protein n=1 Tax=Nonomuraea diastatica TaxID=1848329 RepID=A0A4R4WJZ4_9ACTN|nr:hypothetical protein [Nonomuraea diastatica]TDD18771.1 hypothetical protein E1294_23065 [Nonomuraea diastatica]
MTTSPEPPHGDEPPPRWSQPPPYSQPPQQPRPANQVLSIIGFLCAAVAVLFVPIVFGLAGIVLGIVGHTRGEPLGKWAAVAAGVGMILGFLLGILVTSSMSA